MPVVDAVIRFKDEGNISNAYICVGELPDGWTDEDIFFYVANEDELNSLLKEDNPEDFIIIEVLT